MNSTPCTDAGIQSAPFYAFNLAVRCGAKTRTGMPCKSPAVRSRARCRMHGGAKGSGAPKGNQNAFKHGLATVEIKQYHIDSKKLLRQCLELINNIANIE